MKKDGGKKKLSAREVKPKNRKEKNVKFGIDRDEENRQIKEYLRTGDERIIEEVYKKRIPTIQFLARRYHWLTEDAASEINVVFTRTVNRYGKNGKKTDFNTFFFSSVKNHFSNLAKKKYRKKRTTLDGNCPDSITIPLDSCVGDDESTQFHELIADDGESRSSDLRTQDFIRDICEDDDFLFEALQLTIDLTKRQIVRREITFEHWFPLVTGDIYTDIASCTTLPSEAYDVIEHVIENGKIKCLIKMNNKAFLSFVAKKVRESGIVNVPLEG